MVWYHPYLTTLVCKLILLVFKFELIAFKIICLQSAEEDDTYNNDKNKTEVNVNESKFLLYSVFAIIAVGIYCKFIDIIMYCILICH